jgi:hypothetical protein
MNVMLRTLLGGSVLMLSPRRRSARRRGDCSDRRHVKDESGGVLPGVDIAVDADRDRVRRAPPSRTRTAATR